MIVGKFVEQQIEPRYSPGGGVDYGAEGKILLVYRGKRILWRKAHKYWSGLYMPWSYAPVRLEIRDEGNQALRVMGEDVLSGGHLTLDRLAKVLPTIRKLLGLPELRIKHFDLKKTFVISRIRRAK